ncbi:hypothetical protein [Microbacterium sp. Clip185]|uniref:hypothetical protein n=1 Tax=Microbacterium sp. Clip185 TaxID=3025663 RepID=UPI0023655D46|nr:hypothetical protein [Microbacterium sp. Clip185]WDG17490.1 hypothetical protein PQV94_12790 [Microbacterium sp. Clip185]
MRLGEWVWLDLANVPGVLDWVAFVLGGAGIGFTIWQLLRSRSALVAAQKALEHTQSVLIRNQLLAVLPPFSELSDRLDAAMRSNSREEAEQALSRFCYQSSEAAALLKNSGLDHTEIVQKMVVTTRAAQVARAGLFDNEEMTVADIVGIAATTIRDLGPEVHGVAVVIRNDAGGVQDVHG